MDVIDLFAWTNQHFVLVYNSTFVSALITDYPNAQWRMQMRKLPSSITVVYQWTTPGITNTPFLGTISASPSTGLTILAPQSGVAPLAGVYAYDIRLEDAASNAVLVVLTGKLIIQQGVSLGTTDTGPPEPTAIPTVVTQSNPDSASTAIFVSSGALMNYAGLWNAAINATAPINGTGAAGMLASGTGTQGQVWQVSAAGTTNLDGISSWALGDLAFFDGAYWRKLVGFTPLVVKFSDLVGSAAPSQLPLASSSTLGGVYTAAAAAHHFMTGIDVTGTPTFAQPSAADITGLATSATTDVTVADNISSGTLNIARLPSLSSLYVPASRLLAPCLISALPAPNTCQGARGMVTNSGYSVASYSVGQTLTPSPTGSYVVPVYSDGTNWIVQL